MAFFQIHKNGQNVWGETTFEYAEQALRALADAPEGAEIVEIDLAGVVIRRIPAEPTERFSVSKMADPPDSTLTQGSYSLSDKLAIALACGSAAIVVLLFLAEKTPLAVVLLGLVTVALSVYPILHFIHRNTARIGAVLVVVAVVVIIAVQGLKYSPHSEERAPAASVSSQPQAEKTTSPGGLAEQGAGTRDSVSVEVRPAVPRIEFSFASSGDKRQKVKSSVLPIDIELEPLPTLVKDEDLPKEVKLAAGTITVLRFGQGYMLFDTSGVPAGTTIRGRIISYDALTGLTPSALRKKSMPRVQEGARQNGVAGSNAESRSRAAPGQTAQQYCPNGICIGANNFGTATVNNFAPPSRRLPEPEKTLIAECLRARPGRFTVDAVMNNNEAYTYAGDWLDIFTRGGWENTNKQIPIGIFMIGGGMWSGIRFNVHNASPAPSAKPGPEALADGSPEQTFYQCVSKQPVPGGAVVIPYKGAQTGVVTVLVSTQQ